uniref:Uncharacterized protein n=1 Tax=Panagrellus redivivus TaxID=6233 RepID=A0A7E4ZXX3_PANRE
MSNEVKSADSLSVPPVYTILRRQLRSPYDVMTYADKREPAQGYWDECQFSPMSCLLRRRRRAVQMPSF